MKGSVRREQSFNTAESETLGMWGNSMSENREALRTPALDGSEGRSKKAKSRNVDMHVCRESDGLVVPTKRANKVGAEAIHRVCGAYGKQQEGIGGCGLALCFIMSRRSCSERVIGN